MVTQLFLRVYPARESKQAGVGAVHSGKEFAVEPAISRVIPLHDGWLVIQL